jgi:peptidoglycan/LPS O-acetylase OafA/YrhL
MPSKGFLSMGPARIIRQRDVPALTGLRGIAALWVVAYHINEQISIFAPGYLGVDVFFILSGYILSFVYNKPSDIRGVKSYGKFLIIRLVRIYPLYFVALIVLGVFVLLNPGFTEIYQFSAEKFSLEAYFASLFLVQNWFYFRPSCWNAPAWTLSAEWFAYLSFPIFQTITRWPRTSLGPILLSGCCLAIFAAVVTVKGLSSPDATGTPGMVRMSCEFAAGCLLFTAVRNGLPCLNAWADVGAWGLLALVVVFGGSVTWLALPAFGLILLLAAQQRGPTSRVLALPAVVWLGEVSYSLYITHWIVLQAGKWEISGLHLTGFLANKSFQSVVMAALCMATAACTYQWIELPSRARGRAWADRLFGVAKLSPPAIASTYTNRHYR